MDIAKESVERFGHGHTIVGATPVQLTTLGLAAYKGILLRCPGEADPTGNTDPVWVGNSPTVTADSTPATGGMPILPGSAMFIPIDSPTRLWVVSSASDQDIAWMLV